VQSQVHFQTLAARAEKSNEGEATMKNKLYRLVIGLAFIAFGISAIAQGRVGIGGSRNQPPTSYLEGPLLIILATLLILAGIAYVLPANTTRFLTDTLLSGLGLILSPFFKFLRYLSLLFFKPSEAQALNSQGVAHNKAGNDDLALNAYSQAIALNPQFANAYSNRGWSYFCQNDYTQAIVDYGVAININPTHVLAFSNRGLAYYKMKEYDKATADFETALKLGVREPNKGHVEKMLAEMKTKRPSSTNS
jgi:tetratricopeptide (TPR) repeat protein